MPDALAAFDAIPASAAEKQEAYYQLVMGYAPLAAMAGGTLAGRRNAAEVPGREMDAQGLRRCRPLGTRSEEHGRRIVSAEYRCRRLFRTRLRSHRRSSSSRGTNHEKRDFARSSQMFIEHLAKYVDRDTTNRGKAGYWGRARFRACGPRRRCVCALRGARPIDMGAKLVRPSRKSAACGAQGKVRC